MIKQANSFGAVGSFGFGSPSLNSIFSLPNRIKTVSGSAPLPLTLRRNTIPLSIRLYGNTVDGTGVGDKTINLSNIRTAPFCNFYANVYVEEGKTYTVSGIWTAELAEKRCNLYIRDDSGNDLYAYRFITFEHNVRVGYSFTPTVSGQLYVNGFTAKQIMTDVMVAEGENIIDYEPYGYKIPLIVENNGASLYNVFTDNPLFSGQSLELAPKEYNITLSKGKTTVSTSTAIKPEEITITYKL